MPSTERVALRRGATDAVQRALARHPVVVLVGGPGVGRTGVARSAASAEPIDLAQDSPARRAALASPASFVAQLAHGSIVDNADAVPGVLAALEQLAERTGQPGHVLAVSSTSGLRHEAKTHRLGRLPRVTVGSLTRAEVHGRIGRLIHAAFAGDPAQWPFESSSLADYVETGLAGGLPGLHDVADAEDRAWAYVDWVERTAASVPPGEQDVLRRVLSLVLVRPSARISYEQDAAELGISGNQLAAALETLEGLGLVRPSPAWTRFRRSADSVRAYAADPGFLNAAGLLGTGPGAAGRPATAGSGAVVPRGPSAALVLRTMVAHELHVQNAWSRRPVKISFWRSKPSQYDIDFLLEDGDDAVVPISVSTSLAPASAEFAGIDAFRRRHPRAYRRGLLLHPGDRIRALSDGRWAVPLSVLWTVGDHDSPLDVASLDDELAAAASAMRVYVSRTSIDHHIGERRAELCVAMARSFTPRLARIALVLGSLDLAVRPVGPLAVPAGDEDGPEAPAWLDGLCETLAGAVAHAQVSVIAGMEIDPPQHQPSGPVCWVAYVGAVLASDATVHWQAGHALLRTADAEPDPPARATGPAVTHVGVVGPLSGARCDVDEAMADQLCAALAASLPDALAALAPLA